MKPLVTFITPPSLFLLDEKVFPSLGILKVAAQAEQLGYPVEHLDLNGVINYEEAILNHCANTESRVFAITATTPQMVAVTKINKVINTALPDAKVILGGPHPTLVLAAVKNTVSSRARDAATTLMDDYDVIVAGDGEDAIEAAIEGTTRIIDADDPHGVNKMFLTKERMEELPLPARHLVDLDSYHYMIDGIRTTPIIGQLGCPFGCNFCAGRDSAMLRRTRLRPVQSIVDEIHSLYLEYGYMGFMFFDDELNVNPQMIELMKALCQLQDQLRVRFRFRGFVKAELFTQEQAAWMMMAGFKKILCGFESGNDKILRNINKRATKDDNTRAMELSHKYGLGMKALMSLGHPGESEDTVEDTMRWLLEVQPDDFDVTIITAYPGSPYYDRAEHLEGSTWRFKVNGDSLYMEDIDYTKVEDFYKGMIGEYKSYVSTDALNQEQIVLLRDYVESSVRLRLGIKFNEAKAGVKFEASMGQLPGSIYRRTN